MKTEIIKAVTFLCMFLVLGLQSLLHGSWTAKEPKPVETKNK
ncbi:hypothetical protein [Ulvibacterium sp.]|nr:hypothetical protein [Ulvibacterium sp.]